MVWDQSSSVMSQGDLLLAARKGSAVPLGAGCDANGDPTTDPSAILDGGAILPFGGHKGASIAVMVEILAAALTGSPFGFEDTSPGAAGTTSKGGQFILLIDPERGNSRFDARANELMTAIMGAGADRLPGDRRYRHRLASIRDGVRIARSDFQSLLEFAGAARG